MTRELITLTNPIEIGGETISTLAIRPPTEADFAAVRRLNVSRLNRGTRFIARLVDVPREALFDLSPADQRQIEAFLESHGL